MKGFVRAVYGVVFVCLFGAAMAQEGDVIPPPPPAGTLVAGPYLLGVSDTEMVIQWEVQGPRVATVVLQSPDLSTRRVDGLLLPPSERDKHLKGRVYRVTLRGLTPCSLYAYRLEPFEESGLHEFRTPPPLGESCGRPLSIAVYGDSRSHPERHAEVAGKVAEHEPDLVVHTGDIVNFARRVDEWQAFFQSAASLLASAPLALAAGNHEGYKAPSFGAAMMERYLGLPHRNGAGHYSFDIGTVHVVILDAYWGQPLSDKGRKWLERDLASVPPDRYKFVAIHTPLYSFGRHTVYGTARSLREVMKKYRVHAVFSGHSHCYEHFFADGTHYLTLGGGGASFHPPNQKVIPEELPLLVAAGAFHHFLLIDVHDEGLRMRIFNTDDNTVQEEWKVPRVAAGLRLDQP
jgi:hypothetical protein